MDEGGTWDSLRPRMVALNLDPQRVENSLDNGTPDVNYTHGWLELKYLDAWPRRPGTLVTVRKLVERATTLAPSRSAAPVTSCTSWPAGAAAGPTAQPAGSTSATGSRAGARTWSPTTTPGSCACVAAVA
jgi:hypothetical protein